MLKAVEAFVAQISSGVGLLLGLNYYALVWSFWGAAFQLTKLRKFPGLSAIPFVLFSMMLGALLSTFAADVMGVTKPVYISMLALIGGASWQTLIAIAIRSSEEGFKSVMKSFFSSFDKDKDPPP